MRSSIVNTITIPAAGSTTPGTLYVAADLPMRCLVRNTGPNLLFLAHNSSDLVNNGTSGIIATFQLPPDRSEVFVLAPRQGIYAVGFGGGSQASIAVSEAIPLAKMES